jgi:uncharacterized UBP type Zn finger protein
MPEIKIPNALLRLAWTGKIREKPCTHLDQIQEVEANTDVCEACAQLGHSWVHLRMCMICGNIGCCSSSKNNHALQHYHETGHPLIKPYMQSGMEWIWCYEDGALLSPRG